MAYINAFWVGGLICVIAQVLIDKTKLTPGRILVSFVVIGVILGGLGIYDKLVEFAGAGATVPIVGFGNVLAKGAIKAVGEKRLAWSIAWRCTGGCRRNKRIYCFWIFNCFNIQPQK